MRQFHLVDQAELNSLEEMHPLVFLDQNRRHNPVGFFSRMRDCPGIYPDFPLFFYVSSEESIVASVKSLPDTLHRGPEKYKWAWAGDLFTDPEHRGQGHASFLWKSMVDKFLERDYFVAGAFANPITTHICRKMGFTVPDRAYRLLFLKNARAFLGAHSHFNKLNSALDSIFRGVVRGLKTSVLRPDDLSNSGIEVSEWDGSDHQVFDDLDRSGLHYFDDSPQKTRWKLRGSNCTPYLITGDDLAGSLMYIIIKHRHIENRFGYSNFNLMTLMDFGIHREVKDGPRILLAVLEKMFWDSDAEVLEIVTSDPRLLRESYKKGFLKVGRGIEFWFKEPEGVDLGPAADKICNWHFTHFISDSYSFG